MLCKHKVGSSNLSGGTTQRKHMSKLSDTLKAALDKKKGIHHVDGSDATTTVEKKAKVKPSAGPAKKPPTRSAGRGR